MKKALQEKFIWFDSIYMEVLHNFQGLVQNEKVGPLLKYYEFQKNYEFQNYYSRALYKV